MANHEVEEQIKLFWNQQQEQIADIDPETTDFKIHGTVAGYTNTSDLQALVAASSDFNDFQSRIAAL